MSSSFTRMFSSGAGEGDDADLDREHPPPPPWFGPPDADELGAVVSLGLVLGRSEKGVVALSHATVYSTGVGFDLTAVARGLTRSQWNRLFHEQHLFGEGEEPSSGFLRLGLELPDGNRVSNLGRRMGGRFMKPDEEPDEPVLMQRGGGSGAAGEGRVKMNLGFWLWPRPGSGALRVFCEWPIAEISLSPVDIDTGELEAAAERVTPIWPEPSA